MVLTSSSPGPPDGLPSLKQATTDHGKSRRLRLTVVALEWPSFGRATGGEGRYTQRLCIELAAQVQLTVLTGPDPIPSDGVELLPVALSHHDRFDRYYRAPFRAASAARETAPEVVHAHQDDWPLAFDLKWKVPIVRTYHGRKMAEAMTSRWVRRLNHYGLAGIETACRRRYPVAVGVGPDSVRAFRCSHLIPPVFLTGEPPPPVTKAREPLVAFVGDFASRKRGALALSTAARARRFLPDLRFAVVGPPGDRPNYPPWVEFLAVPDDDEVRDLIAKAWVLLVPSAYEGSASPHGKPCWPGPGGRHHQPGDRLCLGWRHVLHGRET